MFLTRAIYVSTPTVPMGPKDREAVMNQISEAGLRHNPDNGISGLLAYDSDRFVQVLEGERAMLTETLIRIAADSRHTDFQLFSMEEINHRLFEDWAAMLISPGDWPASQPRRVTFECLTSEGLLERLLHIRRYGVVAVRPISGAA